MAVSHGPWWGMAGHGGAWPCAGHRPCRPVCAWFAHGLRCFSLFAAQVRAPSIFKLYFGREEATAESFDSEGFFCTGDTGVCEDGCVPTSHDIDNDNDIMTMIMIMKTIPPGQLAKLPQAPLTYCRLLQTSLGPCATVHACLRVCAQGVPHPRPHLRRHHQERRLQGTKPPPQTAPFS